MKRAVYCLNCNWMLGWLYTEKDDRDIECGKCHQTNHLYAKDSQ